MQIEFKECPKCSQANGIIVMSEENDNFIEKKIFKCDACSYQPKIIGL